MEKPAQPQNLDMNERFVEALDAMNNIDVPFVFITGRAGTGKSTLLRHFRETTTLPAVFLAPTGVAALNIQGETMHSFFHFGPGITVNEARKKGAKANKELYDLIKVIVIDEISMVRADLLDCIDAFLRAALHTSRAFGGKRLVVIGDLYQLPPIVRQEEMGAFKARYETPYFFSSDVVKNLLALGDMRHIELEKMYRQSDETFIALLNGVRNRSITMEQLVQVNNRVTEEEHDGSTIILTTTNAAADEINSRQLAAIEVESTIYTGTRKGTFAEKDLPNEEQLRLKRGSRVMMIANDSLGRWVNGTLGTVEKLNKASVDVEIDGGATVTVEPHTWTMFRSVYDEESASLEQEKLGSYTQLPLKLAWATTIHKSQGKTFDRCVIDLGRGAFAAGQVYVALSRCRTLEGISLVKPVTHRQLLLDQQVVTFLASLQEKVAA